MVFEMNTQLDFLESETHVLQSDKASLYIKRMELRLAGLEACTAAIRTEIAVVKDDIEGLKLRLSKIKTDIAAIKANIESIELKLSNLETRQVKMQADIESIGLRLSNLDAGQVKIQTDIESLELKLSNAEAERLVIKAKIGNIKNDIWKIGRDIYSIECDKSRRDINKLGVMLMICLAVSTGAIISMILILAK